MAAVTIAPASRALRFEWEEHLRHSGARGSNLCALCRNDDAENLVEYFCPPRPGKPTALNFLCWLRRSGVTGWHFESGAAGRSSVARSGRSAPAVALQRRTVPIQRPRLARFNCSVRKTARTAKDYSRAWRSARGGMDPRAARGRVAVLGRDRPNPERGG